MIDEAKDVAGKGARSPGAMLRAAREKKDLSIADAAHDLHLRPSIVTAIETGQYELVPGVIFLKGYVRSYSRLVGLDEASMIAMLEDELSQQQAQVDQQLHEKEFKRRKGLLWLWLVVLLVVAVAAAVVSKDLLLEFWSPAPSTVPAGKKDQATVFESKNPDQPSEPVDAPPQLPVFDPLVQTSPAVPEPAAEGDEAGISAGQDATEALSVTSSGGASVPKVVLPDPVLEQALSSAPLLSATLAPAPQVQPLPSTSVALPQSEAIQGAVLEMSFRGDSWVQVSDAHGKRLVSALKREGSSLRITGEAPLKVVVGAASVSDLMFNGKPVNYDDYKVRNNRAELLLE